MIYFYRVLKISCININIYDDYDKTKYNSDCEY